MTPRALLLLPAFLLYTAAVLAAGPNSIIDSPHNLSSSGPGIVRATDMDQVCIFCHTPHGARDVAPLWNRKDSGAAYIPYDSPTLKASPGQPTGSSKLCLSCHDGTVGFGDLVSTKTPISMSGSPVMPPGPSLIGTDLRDDHPISFPYSESYAGSSGELAPPHSWDSAIRLDAAGMMQCTTCHDPHDNQWGKFLVTSNNSARLCRECHTITDFDGTPHATSNATWKGTGKNPWKHTEFTDVASNSCMNCHTSHHAPGAEELLTAPTSAETCLTCHDGSVAQSDLRSVFRKPYRHPVERSGSLHRAGERADGLAEHVTCVDCHNPHKATPREAQAPFVSGMLEGVSGITAAGTSINEAVFEYEVCFKCHSQDQSGTFSEFNRQVDSRNVLRQFAAGNASAHPVINPGSATEVPSLIAPLNNQSMIYCSDCHGDDSSASPTAKSPGGPHGSRFRSLLKREYQTGERITESATAYALCYGCHDRSSILADESFAGHRRHIVDQSTPCSACHDAHGIDGTIGNTTNNAHLINFDLAVVQPLPATGQLEYRSLGLQSGNCTLRCHGVDHDQREYGPGARR